MSILKNYSSLLLLASLGLPAWPQRQDDPRSLMFQARIKQQEAGGDDPRGAIPLYQKAVALEPTSSEAHLRLSEAYLESNDAEKALAPAVKATELNPRNAEAWFILGTIQNQRGQSDSSARAQARDAFLEASRLLPNDPEVWFRLAQISQAMGDDETALKAWLGLGRMHPTLRLNNAPLEDIAWERAALLGATLNRYDARREAIMALCQHERPLEQHLHLLEELAKEQADKAFLGHAEESFLLLGTHYPLEPAIWENIARIQLQTGRFAEALQTYRKAEALRPSPRLSYFQGLCLMCLGRLSEAETIWRELFASKVLPSEDPQFLQNARFYHAADLLMQGRPRDMLALLDGWPESGNQGELLALRVQAAIQTKDWKGAYASLEEGMLRFSEQALFQAAKELPPGLLKEKTITRKDAVQALAQLDCENMAALWNEFRQWEQCLEMVQLALKASPAKRPDLYMMQSNALDQLGRPAEAIQALREAQKLDPAFPMLQNNLGYLLLENGGDLQEASQLIASAMAQDPKNGSTMDSWGWALYKQGKFKEAEEALRKAVTLTPLSPEIRKHLGEVLLKLDRPEEALEQWERALPFAFPQRAELEVQTEKLRVEIAKKQRAKDGTSRQEPEEAPEEEEETP
ncbi:MAG TPA: tetratricopeptide repeat protein [Holophaga sp.]|nr:tetratricopeptide repeat protein [Holophaga sp.]HPS67284.1 tetratricopeptide repeat protein [Holophaga sp.]